MHHGGDGADSARAANDLPAEQRRDHRKKHEAGERLPKRLPHGAAIMTDVTVRFKLEGDHRSLRRSTDSAEP